MNAIFFDKPKEEPKEMTTYTSKLDGMTDEERDDYLGSLWFSTERSREKFNNDTKNRYALIVDEMWNFKYIDKCEDSNFYDKVDRSLCNKWTIDKIDNNNTYYSRTYGSDISYKLTSSYNEECQEPENPYWDWWHSAWFDRAEETWGYCDGNSESFNEWCEEYYRQLEEYEACEYNQ